MIRYVVAIAAIVLATATGFHFGQQNVEIKWAREREALLANQINTIQQKNDEIAKLHASISNLNDSAQRVRDKNTELQRRLQTELGDCSRFKRALEKCSETLTECAGHATRDRKLLEWCSIQLK